MTGPGNPRPAAARANGLPWVLLACAVAAVLGLSRLDATGLWWEEIHTARWTRLGTGALGLALRTELHPPLFFLIERVFVRMLGESEWALRLLPVLAAVATVAATWWAFRPLLRERLAVASAWVLALHPEFFLCARMARYYAFAALFAMIAHGLFLRLVVKRGRPRSWLLYGLSVAALLYTSYVGVCVVVAHGVWAVAARRRRPRLASAWLAAAGGGTALFAPWAVALVRQASAAKELHPQWVHGPQGLALMLGYDLHALTASELLAPWTPAGATGLIAGLVLLALGGLAVLRRGLGRSVLLPAGVALGLAWIIVGSLAHATPFVGLPPRSLFMWPFAAAVLAIGAFDSVYDRALRGGIAVLVLAAWAVGWTHLLDARDWLNPIYLTPGREVASAVAERAQPADVVLAEDDSGVNYYLDRMRFPGRVADPGDDSAQQRLLGDSTVTRVWFVRLSRDGSALERPAEPELARLRAWGRCDSETGYLPADKVFDQLKRRLLGLPGYSHRILVQHWIRRDENPAAPSNRGQDGTTEPVPGKPL